MRSRFEMNCFRNYLTVSVNVRIVNPFVFVVVVVVVVVFCNLSAFIFQFQCLHIRALCNFFGQEDQVRMRPYAYALCLKSQGAGGDWKKETG